jgi:acyl-CoA synthetase (AMP-forming)/AMP-acid ligase II
LELEDETAFTFREGWHHTGDLGRLDEVLLGDFTIKVKLMVAAKPRRSAPSR